jgi:mannose-6-phosphate isomerase-like protein (cupin superfamily)
MSDPVARLAPRFLPASDNYAHLKRQQAERSQETRASAFKVRAQLLDQGRSDTVLAATPALTVTLKVYASGGENTLHSHLNEDHVFVVLQGSAEFFDGQGLLVAVGANEGVTLPRGQLYRFHATSIEPLVMLRIGSPNEAAQGLEGRVSSDGQHMPGDSQQNKAVVRIPKADAFFG